MGADARLLSGSAMVSGEGVSGWGDPVGYHFYAGKVRRDLAAGRCRLTSRQCRLINEVPVVPLVLMVIMAVVKPLLWG